MFQGFHLLAGGAVGCIAGYLLSRHRFNQMNEQLAASRQELEREHRELDAALVRLRATQRELVQSEKLKALGTMLAGLAHELNNPLASVLAASEVLEQELAESPDADSKALGRELAVPLVREALRVRALVRNLLHFARDTELVLRPVSLGETIAEAVHLHAPAWSQSALRLHLHLGEDLYVEAEPVRLQQVWLNIIANARDAMSAGCGTLLRITARRRSRAEVEVLFEDDGPGLADVERIFEPFYTTKDIGEGTGLGLSIVERVVSEFGGAVRAENRRTGGARFVVTLTATEPAIAAEELPPQRATGTARILLIDDEPSVRALQQRMLQRAGYAVTLATSGREAQLRLSESTPDLVISDLKMPGTIDGLALYDWALAADWRVAQRFLFVTGDVNPMLLQRFGSDAPKRMLRKPFRQSEYLATIADRLRSS